MGRGCDSAVQMFVERRLRRSKCGQDLVERSTSCVREPRAEKVVRGAALFAAAASDVVARSRQYVLKIGQSFQFARALLVSLRAHSWILAPSVRSRFLPASCRG